MERISCRERSNWRATADELGFLFHTEDGDPYWDESAYYRFSLRQIEQDLEAVTAELDQMCREFVDRAVRSEAMLTRLKVPEFAWEMIRRSWFERHSHLYGRMDFAYDGSGPAKFYEYNADTPTALYEAAIFQWVWLEQAIEQGVIPQGSDQFNFIHEQLVETFEGLKLEGPLHCACVRDTIEDLGTVEYIQDCAHQAGLKTRLVYVEDIGVNKDKLFNDLDDEPILNLFKLYPWEWMLEEEYGRLVPDCDTRFIEPAWKAILSNKGLLPYLWEMFPGHPNLLPAFFEGDAGAAELGDNFVRKPLFSREGSNIRVVLGGRTTVDNTGPYGREGFILQAYHAMPRFVGNNTIVGSWVVGGEACGIGIREDTTLVTRDLARFLPHIISA